MTTLASTANDGPSTSTMLAAWNAAVYVAQIEEDRIMAELERGAYLDATTDVVRRHGGLWFQDESFVVVRKSGVPGSTSG